MTVKPTRPTLSDDPMSVLRRRWNRPPPDNGYARAKAVQYMYRAQDELFIGFCIGRAIRFVFMLFWMPLSFTWLVVSGFFKHINDIMWFVFFVAVVGWSGFFVFLYLRSKGVL